jgi:hypothetical protein
VLKTSLFKITQGEKSPAMLNHKGFQQTENFKQGNTHVNSKKFILMVQLIFYYCKPARAEKIF